jgi:hypothetical protein
LPVYFFVDDKNLSGIKIIEDVIIRKYLKFFHSDYYFKNPRNESFSQKLEDYEIIAKLSTKNPSESIYKIKYKGEELILKKIELLDQINRPNFEKEVIQFNLHFNRWI